ncbi:MAG: BamA/TamA family outer membrane protein [Acidobacteria bacterium]|nr:BamA/TamA family outer membrane protein [Acidobacteriota bacterium]
MGGNAVICLRRVATPRVVFGLLLLLMASRADAQYFGRNKVEYADFSFRVLATEHFDIYHYAREEDAARIAARLAERWYSRFSRLLDHQFSERQILVLYGSQPEFSQTNVVSGLLSDTVGGVTESTRRRIVMPFAPTMGETDRVLGHELAHAFQFDISKQARASLTQPLWFVEGMAEYLARGRSDAEARLWLHDVVTGPGIPERERDASRKLSPYKYGHAFWAYVTERFGDEVIGKALRPSKRSQAKDRIRDATGVDLDTIFADWRTLAYAAVGTAPVHEGATATHPLPVGSSRHMQLGPALSPDGRQVVFFSERDQFALDLFLADASTGRVIRKIATTTANTRFDSLQPLRSAGSWSPDGRSFAFSAIRQGRPTLVLMDMAGRSRDREIPFNGLDQILTAAWSPDGRAFVLSALAGGFSNLYLYDIAEARLRQLTDDAYADLHPAWSPDGREIAFASDRFSSNLNTLQFGQNQLAFIDLRSGHVRPAMTNFAGASSVNPQWSADGRHLFFVGYLRDANQIFRLTVSNGDVRQMTSMPANVGGLTPTSPSLSAAREADVLAFTAYFTGKPQLAILDKNAALAVEDVPDAPLAPTPHPGPLAALLDDHLTGLAEPNEMSVTAYSPRLTLERIGQPYLSSGGGALGSFVRAGGSMLFGDVLGGRRLGTAIQVANRMRDVAFETRYLNQERRWNWGGLAELAPAVRRHRLNSIVERGQDTALVKQVDYLQRMQLRVAGLVAYPFSRGLRAEFTGGARHERFHRDRRSRVSSMNTGRILEEARVESSGGAPSTVAEFGAALVGDTTAFGPTGPLLGSRFRVEVTPAMGDMVYTSLLADYRRYVMPARPYTLAMRVLHSGRYGPDGNDSRLLPTFLGSRSLVRGHGFDARDCRPAQTEWCGGELLGTRMVVANLELRFPLLGIASRQLTYGRFPLDAFVFADGGIAWSDKTPGMFDPSLNTGRLRRSLISSVGFGIRTNAGGMPFEIGAVRANDGPTPGWSADFGFRTGF